MRALWKMVNFTVPQTPLVEGEADLLGVAHCWRSNEPTVASTAASHELRNEIHNEEEELFRDIFLEARGLQALQASQEAQQQMMVRLQQQQRRQLLSEENVQKSTSLSDIQETCEDVTGASRTISPVGGYDSMSYQGEEVLQFSLSLSL